MTDTNHRGSNEDHEANEERGATEDRHLGEDRPTNERRSGRGLWWLGVICALAIGLPFLNKPVHIDDTVVLDVANQITKDPLRPYSFDFFWFDDYESIYPRTTNPPFVSYWLAPVLALFGPNEIALHLSLLPFLILFGISMAALSSRFANGSAWPVLLVMFSPAVVVSPNLMRDVPAAALATGAVALFVTGVDRDRWLHVLGGACLGGLAMVTKYSAVVIVPVLALYPLLKWKPRYLAALLLSVAILGLWFLQNELVHGSIHLTAMKQAEVGDLDWKQRLVAARDKFIAAMVITGASFVVLPGLLAGAARRRDGAVPSVTVILVILMALLLIARFMPLLANYVRPDNVKEHVWGMLQHDTWALLGAATACWAVSTGLFAGGRWWNAPPERQEGFDSLFLLWWMIGPYICGIFFVGFPAVRHVLPAAAPIVLLIVRYIQRGKGSAAGWVGIALAVGLLIQAGLAYWTALADYQYADTYRQFARTAAEKYAAEDPDTDIWYYGHWGWQHYAREAGFRPITLSGERPEPGDIILKPDIVHKGAMPPGLSERLEEIATESPPARLGMVTMDWAYASFYATFGTTVPERFVKGKAYETFHVYRVKPEDPGG